MVAAVSSRRVKRAFISRFTFSRVPVEAGNTELRDMPPYSGVWHTDVPNTGATYTGLSVGARLSNPQS